MKKLAWIALLALLALGSATRAAEIGPVDAGTYQMDGKDGRPIQMFLRLSQAGGKWVMEAKSGSEPWQNISCDRGCEFRVSDAKETDAFLATLPASMSTGFHLACIQNIAQAFCKAMKKDDPRRGGYLMFALVTGTPIPGSLTRVSP